MELIKQMKLRNLRLIFIILIMLMPISFVSSEETDVFVIHLKYLNENISLETISLAKMNYFPPTSISKGRYKIDMVSNSKEILFSQKFDFSLEIFGAPDSEEKSIFEGTGGQIIFLNESVKELIIPYFSNAEKLVVYDEDKLVLEYGLSEYADVDESKLNEQFGVIESEVDIGDDKKSNYLIYVLLGFVFVIILIFIIIRMFKKENLINN